MNNFRIDARIKKDDEIVSGEVTFDNLEKLEYDNLDMLIMFLIKTLDDEDNKIELVSVDILYREECCGNYTMILSFSDINVLRNVANTFLYLRHKYITNHEEKHEEIVTAERIYFEEFDESLKKYAFADSFMMKFEKK